ncbi:MAG: calcium-binding protein, partial [Alphaproteobacteria bacterium]|nr:calcium-binding protein [Alphaproteobacteria bacterium]
VDGGLGNDTIFGDDLVEGPDDGDDQIQGGGGNDTIFAGGGNDQMAGDGGNDTMSGGSGNDVMLGGAGNDTMSGHSSGDFMDGGDGADKMNGDEGADCMKGGDGNDTMDGGDGADTMLGGNGADTMLGGLGHDRIHGGDGDDKISGGKGSDALAGGAGNDTFIFFQDEVDGVNDHDVISDWDSGDRIMLWGQPEFTPVKIQYINADFVPGPGNDETNDVFIQLSNGQKITILNAKADFAEALDFTPNFVDNTVPDGANADDFVHAGFDPSCIIDCVVPPVPNVPVPFDFWASFGQV